jgi:hypothetical protein
MNIGIGAWLVLALFVLATAAEVQGCGPVSHATGTGERARRVIESTFVCCTAFLQESGVVTRSDCRGRAA